MCPSDADIPAIGYVVASKRVAVDRLKVRWMYRQAPDNPEDSGWRVFSGYEDQSYADNPDHFGVYSPCTIADIDKRIIPLLHEPVGSAYESMSDDAAFCEVQDFELPSDA